MPRRTTSPTISPRGQRVLLALTVVGLLSFVAGVASGAGSGGPSALPYIRRLGPVPLSAAQQEDRALRRVLSYTSYIDRGTPNKPEVALTFDDGPGPYTPQVLRVLNQEHVPATFFVVGSQYASFSLAGQAAAVDGFAVGTHTQDHRAMGSLDVQDQNAQLDEGMASMNHAGLPTPHLFRPPYGSFNQTTLAVLKQKKLLMVLWAVDSEDWQTPGVDAIVHNVLGSVKAGDVILMHDAGGTRDQTVAALPTIIAGLRKRGLTPVTVPQLLVDDPPPHDQPPPPNLDGGG